MLGFPTYTVARNLDNPYLDRYLAGFRAATGQHLIPKNGGYEQIERVLSGGGTMAFLADQYAGEKGCWVEFFGRPASAHKAIALLALEHNAPVAVCYALRRGGPMQFEMVSAAIADPSGSSAEMGTVRDITQWYHGQLEASHSLVARSVLVGPSPLEGHAEETRGEESGMRRKSEIEYEIRNKSQ